MKYEIDLKLPNVCKECGYMCCKHVQKTIKCAKPIFSTDYCYRNTTPLCKSYPLSYDCEKDEFVIKECLGFMSLTKKLQIPEELVQVANNLNYVMRFVDEYRHIGPDVVLNVKKFVNSFE